MLMPTLKDIADHLGISKGTVSKALNNAPDISDALRQTILETAVEMGYKQKRTKITELKKLCIIIENMEYDNPSQFGYDIVLGFRKLAETSGFAVDLVSVTPEFQKGISYEIFMLQNNYLGAFAIGLTLSDPWMTEFETSHTPVVLYDNLIRENKNVACIGANNEEGLYQSVAHLKSLGHTKIGLLSGALGSYITKTRYKAFFHAMKKNDLTVDKNMVGCSYFISDCTQKHLPKILAAGATAIVCTYDLLAHAAMIACQERGLSIPEDVSIIGFDDLPICAYTDPPLTTVRQNRTEIGKCGYYALNSQLNHVYIDTLLLHAELIVRKSTGEVRPA